MELIELLGFSVTGLDFTVLRKGTVAGANTEYRGIAVGYRL